MNMVNIRSIYQMLHIWVHSDKNIESSVMQIVFVCQNDQAKVPWNDVV